jgi:outer membrane protein assembly factor BamD (BamD/ComL family)
MATETTHLLKVFLCHASGDKPPVRDLYKRLIAEGVDAWLDQEKLLPGQDWRLEIPRAVREADVVVICLSKKSITKEGYVQKEIKFALDIAEEKPEGTIFLIPARLEDCVVPERLSRWQWVDLYEENGFIRLLRSLKLRADAVGATIEPTPYEDTDKEIERRIKQLYTEGLAAFYTEDWDRACHRFQSILSEQPNHKNAAEKLAEAERQRNLSKLYAQASEAVRSEDWGTGIRTLEELTQKSPEYKDAASLLRNARKQKQLKDLYAEANTLHDAQKWDAVVKVFEQIAVIEPNYPDLNGLLPSAQKEVAELNRLAELNELYTAAVSEMDAGHWVEARQLLEKIHKSQTGFLETERLLRKVEDEIKKSEEQNERNEQVNVLYEQAHGLLRSKKWRRALDKIEEIEKLESHFDDRDGIAQKAGTELEREESEAQKQNQLAAIYAEAVRLLKEEKYQEALDKWGEVRAVDLKYPDRQWVARTAKRKLAEASKPVRPKTRLVLSRSLWFGVGVVLVVVLSLLVFPSLVDNVEKGVTPAPSMVPTDFTVPSTLLALVRTQLSTETNIPMPVPSSTLDPFSGLVVDDFDDFAFNGNYNDALWRFDTWADDLDPAEFSISQDKGKLALALYDKAGLSLIERQPYVVSKPTFFEARLFLDPETTDKSAGFFIQAITDSGYSLCGIFRTGNYAQQIRCWSEYYQIRADTQLGLEGLLPGWHMFRFNIDPETMIIHYIVDGSEVDSFNPGESIPEHFNEFKSTKFNFVVALDNYGGAIAPVGYADFARFGAIEDDPVLFFDDFNGPVLDITYKALPAGRTPQYKGMPSFSFEMLDRSTIVRLKGTLEPGQSNGLQTTIFFDVGANPIHLEVRFNTMVQSPTTSIDGFLEVGLLDKNTTRYDKVGLFAGNFGRDRTFAGKPYDIKDKTWYRLVITGSKGQVIQAALVDDETGKVLTETGLGSRLDEFTSGIRIGLSQQMGSPSTSYPTDVAIDWIRLMILPSP